MRCGPISFATAPQAPTGMQTMTRSAPSTAAALVSTTWSAMPSSATRLRVAAERAVATIERTALCARAARAIEEPISPTPISARRFEERLGRRAGHPACPMKSASACDHEPVGLLAADGHAQRVRQLVGADLRAGSSPRLREERVGLLGGAALGLGKVDQDEIRHARRDVRARACRSPRSARRASASLCSRARFLVRDVLDRRDAGRDRRAR